MTWESREDANLALTIPQDKVEMGRRSAVLYFHSGSAVNQLFNLEQVFLGLSVPVCETVGLNYNTSKSSSFFDILVPSYPSAPLLHLLLGPAWNRLLYKLGLFKTASTLPDVLDMRISVLSQAC